MTNQTKIVLVSITVIIATGLMALYPSILGNAQAQMYQDQYGYDNSYKNKNHYREPRNSQVEIQKISCLNDNNNINGIDITEIPHDDTALGAANGEAAGTDGANAQNGNGFADKINFNKNLVNICVNVKVNEQSRVTQPETASLTVNKEVFGCNEIGGEFNNEMICDAFQNEADEWLPCTTDPDIKDTVYCQKLTDNLNLFDIELLDSQNTPLQQFQGNAHGTTIQNLQAGTYAVNEIKDPDPNFPVNVLYVSAETEEDYLSNGFSDGGDMFNNVNVPPEATAQYKICFEHKDEQGNDCSNLTLEPGENKLCTVRNYILHGTF